LAAIPGFEPGF